MDTYGDTVTLLLTFFVLLYSFSTIDAGKWTEIVESFTGAPPKNAAISVDIANDPDFKFIRPIAQINPKAQKKTEDVMEAASTLLSALGDGESMVITSSSLEKLMNSQTYQQVEQEFGDLYDSLQTYIKARGLEEMLYVDRDVESIYLRVTSGLLFDSGSAQLREESKEMLDELEEVFYVSLDAVEDINIEGHTDSVPINNAAFQDNRELSSERANQVARYIESKGRIPSDMILGIGYGEHHPIADNDTEEGKQNNRRVEFVLRKKVITLADIEGETQSE